MKKDDKNIYLSPIEQYYESVIEKAKKLVSENQLEQALDILNDELDAPYIPIEQQEKLEDFANQIIADLEYFDGIKNYEKMSRSELFEKVLENNKLDSAALSLFFERYQNDLRDDELDSLIDFLGSRRSKNDYKTLVFLWISNAQIDRNIRYYNNHLKEEFYINTLQTKTYNNIELYKETEKIINELALKEPSLLEFCLKILNLIYVYNFPQVPNFNPNELAFGIFNYMMFALQGSKSNKNIDIFNYINNIIKELEE